MNRLNIISSTVFASAIACAIASATAHAQSLRDDLRASVYRNDSTAVSGTVISADASSIIVRDSRGNQTVRFDDARSVELIQRSRFNLGPIAMAGGAYIGALIGVLGHEDPSGSVFYPEGEDGETATACFALGALAGGIIAAFVERDELDVINAYDVTEARDRSELVDHVANYDVRIADYTPMFHFGFVHGSAAATQSKALADGGYRGLSFENPTSIGPRVTTFSMLRRFELSRAITNAFDITASITLLAQPGLVVNNYSFDSNLVRSGQEIREGYFGYGFQAGPHYQIPLLSGLFRLRAGVSAGFATATLRRTEAQSNDEDGMMQTSKKEVFRAGGSLELVARLDGLLAGLSGDYIVAPTVEIPSDARLGIPASTLKMSSGRIGFMIGLEF